MRTQKTKPAPEKAEEPAEPVRATTTPPADHSVTDALLDTIEVVLEEATVEEQTPKPNLDPDYVSKLIEETSEWFRCEREQRPEPDDIPWEEIARLPPPGPGGRYIQYRVPEEIDWTAQPELRGDADVVAIVPSGIRELLVTREMWTKAQDRVLREGRLDPRNRWFWRGQSRSRSRQRYGGDGMCPRCGWPLSGPGRYPCAGPNPYVVSPEAQPSVDPKWVDRVMEF